MLVWLKAENQRVQAKKHLGHLFSVSQREMDWFVGQN